MGHLLINTSSIDSIGAIPIDKKNNLVNGFILATQSANSNADKTYQDEKLKTGILSFGNYYDDFLYASDEKFKANKAFDGIEQKTHQALQNLMFANPSGGITFESTDKFTEAFKSDHHGFIGLEQKTNLIPYIYCYDSYHNWNIGFYSKRQNKILWVIGSRHCLPNLSYSNSFLVERIKRDVTASEEIAIIKTAKDYCDYFPFKKLDRGQQRAIAFEVGAEIAKRNYYKENSELSSKESQLRKADRLIFESEKNGRTIYLSVDFHKCCCYELCNHNGKHIAEFRFDGILNGGTDTTDEHDIWALSK